MQVMVESYRRWRAFAGGCVGVGDGVGVGVDVTVGVGVGVAFAPASVRMAVE